MLCPSLQISLQLVKQAEQKAVPASAEGEGAGVHEAVDPDKESSQCGGQIADKIEISSDDKISVGSGETEQVRQHADQSTVLKVSSKLINQRLN